MLPVKMKVLGPAGTDGELKEVSASRMAAKVEMMLTFCAVMNAGVEMLKVSRGLEELAVPRGP